MRAQTKRQSQPVAPVLAVCATFAAQPSVYPPEARRPDVAPLYGSVGRKHRNRTRWPREKLLAVNAGIAENGQNRGILDAAARSRINGWRRNRRFSCSQQPAVRTVSRGCAGAAIGACLEKNKRGWHQKSRKRRRFKGFQRATPQNGGL